MTKRKMPVWSPTELYRHLSEGSQFAILDVRNQSEFNAWKIDGKVPIPTVNIPYFDLLDMEDENEELAAAVARAIPKLLKDSLPRSGPILAVCARGETSPHVAEGLRRLGYQAYNLEGGMAAWGDHYEIRAVEETPQLCILQISRPARGCLSYLLASGGEAMVVDAARHIDIYTRIAAERGWSITGVLDSHLAGRPSQRRRGTGEGLGVDYWLHPYDSIHPDDLLPATFTFRYLEDEMTFTLGEVSIRVLHLPGHTLGMINLLVDERFLLSGDTLFIGSIGRPDLGGRAKTWVPLLYRSLQRVLALPDQHHRASGPLQPLCARQTSRAATARASARYAAATRVCACKARDWLHSAHTSRRACRNIRSPMTTSGGSTRACSRWTRRRPANWNSGATAVPSRSAKQRSRRRSACGLVVQLVEMVQKCFAASLWRSRCWGGKVLRTRPQ